MREKGKGYLSEDKGLPLAREEMKWHRGKWWMDRQTDGWIGWVADGWIDG